MTILRKDYVTSVILGTPEIQGVEGTPGRPAYWSLERVSSYEWVDAPGVTWKKVPIDYSGSTTGFWTYDQTGKAIWVSTAGMTDPVLLGNMWRWVPLYLGSENIPPGLTLKRYQKVTKLVPTYHRAEPAVATVPYSPAKPNQISYSLNAGWNSYAISINPLEKGKYLLFNVASGITGAFVGIGPRSKYGAQISSFTHGLLIDPSGIKVYENGEVKATLRSSAKTLSMMRIYRLADNTIVYAVTTESESAAYESTVAAYAGDLYVHGFLYSGGDQILSAQFLTGDVSFSNATITASATCAVQNAKLKITGAATLYVVPPTGAVLSGTATLTAESTYRWGRINCALPAMAALLSDHDFGFIDATLPALTCSMDNAYVPAKAQTIYGNIPPILCSGLLKKSKAGEMAFDLQPVLMKGGDFEYGEIIVGMSPLQALLFQDPEPYVGSMRDYLWVSGGSLLAVHDHVVVISESGNIVDSFSVSRELAQSMLESLEAAGTYSVLGSFSVDFIETVYGRDVAIAALGSKPAFDDSRVWVVNLNTGATAQYDNFGFNSFFEYEGDYYGVADDGIYKLDGEDDNGADIDALVDPGKSNLGSAQKKSVINVYAGVSSSGKMLLKVDADGQEYTYEARSNSEDLKNHRFDVGRGLTGNYYDFTVMNQNGEDFDLESVVFEPVILSRKI